MKKISSLLFATLISVSALKAGAESLPTVNVFKTATCGCCELWVDHLKQQGFQVKSQDVDNLTPYKKLAQIPAGMGSCHTAFVDGYGIEGHVPASDIKQLLQERPNIKGLVVPGMPMGSPGMDFGPKSEPYNTLSYTDEGNIAVFARH